MTREVTRLEQLVALIGEPLPRVRDKVRDRLEPVDVQWLAASRFCLVATADAHGRCDVSPKGDPAGLVHVLDDRTVVVPERAGNRRADGFRNVLENPQVGLLSLVPGRGDTLRINGRASIVADAPYFDDLVVRGHRPLVALVVEIDEVFYHCAKAFLRSELWQPASWPAPDDLPSRARISHLLERPDEALAELERYYGEGYSAGLYPSDDPSAGTPDAG